MDKKITAHVCRVSNYNFNKKRRQKMVQCVKISNEYIETKLSLQKA
jgi:hypothetical protein